MGMPWIVIGITITWLIGSALPDWREIWIFVGLSVTSLIASAFELWRGKKAHDKRRVMAGMVASVISFLFLPIAGMAIINQLDNDQFMEMTRENYKDASPATGE